MKNKNYFLACMVVVLALLNSCKKDIRGCTDSTASNYNSEANQNDGSCQYTGNIVFWNYDFGIGVITVNINSENRNITDDIQPTECGTSGCANFSNLPYGTYAFSASSTTGETWAGSVSISRKCLIYNLY